MPSVPAMLYSVPATPGIMSVVMRSFEKVVMS